MNKKQQKKRKHLLSMCAVALLTVGLVGCQPSQGSLTPVSPDSGKAGNSTKTGTDNEGGRKLTVVKSPQRQENQEVAVARIHRLESASIDKWLSDDELEITTTKVVKPATKTEEAQYAYSTSNVNLASGERSGEVPLEGGVAIGEVLKEQVSPDGKFSFLQHWKDKYTAQNYIKDLSTGESKEIKGENYLEAGEWLDNDTYILAVGSPDGSRGDILQIEANGQTTKLTLVDPDVEYFTKFGAGQGRIYYTDKRGTLKAFAPGQSKPEVLVKNVADFTLSPDKQAIAIGTQTPDGVPNAELRIVDPKGNAKGTLIANGDLISYLSWSPDSSKLAFSVYTEDKSGMNGVYIFDSASGKVSLIGPGYFPQFPLSWNPLGTRLGVTFEETPGNGVTQIIDFK